MAAAAKRVLHRLRGRLDLLRTGYQTISEDANYEDSLSPMKTGWYSSISATQQFKLYTVENGKITSSEVVDYKLAAAIGSAGGVLQNARRGR